MKFTHYIYFNIKFEPYTLLYRQRRVRITFEIRKIRIPLPFTPSYYFASPKIAKIEQQVQSKKDRER